MEIKRKKIVIFKDKRSERDNKIIKEEKLNGSNDETHIYPFTVKLTKGFMSNITKVLNNLSQLENSHIIVGAAAEEITPLQKILYSEDRILFDKVLKEIIATDNDFLENLYIINNDNKPFITANYDKLTRAFTIAFHSYNSLKNIRENEKNFIASILYILLKSNKIKKDKLKLKFSSDFLSSIEKEKDNILNKEQIKELKETLSSIKKYNLDPFYPSDNKIYNDNEKTKEKNYFYDFNRGQKIKLEMLKNKKPLDQYILYIFPYSCFLQDSNILEEVI